MISNSEKQTATSLVIDYVQNKIIEGEWKKGMKIFTEPVLVKEIGEYEEFRVPKGVQETILEMDMSKYLTKK